MIPVDGSEMRAHWRRRGKHWNAQADVIADMAERMNRPLIEAADIRAGQDVLDLASGAGEPALAIAREVGARGFVTATDLVEEMLAGCRRRAAAAGLANIAFDLVDMQDMPFDDARFDRVTCRFGIMFVPDPLLALREVQRVLRPGGRAAFMVWGPREQNSFFDIMAGAGATVFGDDPLLDFSVPFRFAEPGLLAKCFEQAGFKQVAAVDLRFTPEVPADRPFWLSQMQMSMGPRLEQATEAELTALDSAIRAGFEAFRTGNVFKLSALARIVTGIK